MSARWTQDQLEEQAAKFAPERIRRTLAFAGLFQITHEMIKSSVLDQVKGFYGHVRVRGVDHWIGGEEQYKIQVLTKAPGMNRSGFHRDSAVWIPMSSGSLC